VSDRDTTYTCGQAILVVLATIAILAMTAVMGMSLEPGPVVNDGQGYLRAMIGPTR
jgi:hypothetical protein